MKIELSKFKKGAASFYIVAISTLILVIIAASFAAVIISEITRTSNDDLAQSAYDSALAGVEDAKLAYYNYQSCKNGATYTTIEGFDCDKLKKWVEKGETPGDLEDCDMVATILGRTVEVENEKKKGVLVQEGNENNNNMQQYYTCVTMTNKTDNIKSSVTENDPTYTVRVKFDESVDENVINHIETLRVKWHSINEDGEGYGSYEDFDSDGIFGENAVTPAVISVGMIQTSKTFNLSDFDVTRYDAGGNGYTDRGTLYLVPIGEEKDMYTDEKSKTSNGKFIGSWDDSGEHNFISSKDGFLKSNDKTSKNLPYAVYCNPEKADDGFACSVDIDIPKPVGGDRNKDTFMFVVELPYGGSTHFSLEFYCGDDDCSKTSVVNEGGVEEIKSKLAPLDGVQINIDSTGRANDLYRRIETRLESRDDSYPLYGIQVLGGNSNGSGSSLILKDLAPESEHNF